MLAALLISWSLFPVLASATTTKVFVIIMLFFRKPEGRVISGARAFLAISLILSLILISRSLLQDNPVWEPRGLPYPLTAVIVAALAVWRGRVSGSFDLALLMKLAVVMCWTVLVLAMVFSMFADALPAWLPGTGPQRSVLFTGNALLLATVIVLPTVLSAWAGTYFNTRWKWAGYSGVFAGVFVLAGLTQTRGPLLTVFILALAHLVFQLVVYREGKSWLKHALLVTLSMVAAVLLVDLLSSTGIASSMPWSGSGRMTTVSDQSASLRLLMWKGGFRAIQEAPLWGYGIQNRFEAALPYMDFPEGLRLSHLHNTIVTTWVAGGLFAVISVFALLLLPVWTAVSRGLFFTNAGQFALLSSLSFLLIGTTNVILFNDFSIFWTSFTILIALIALTAADAEASGVSEPSTSSKPVGC